MAQLNALASTIFILCSLLNSNRGEPIRGNNVQKVEDGEFPFVVSFNIPDQSPVDDREHFCTGVLISERHVLTAAHCIRTDDSMRRVEILAGHSNLISPYVRKFKPASWLKYEDWIQFSSKKKLKKSAEAYHDIAIVKLATTSTGISPAKLMPMKTKIREGKSILLTGWGKTNHGIKPLIMRKATLTVSSKESCITRAHRIKPDFYDYDSLLKDNTIYFSDDSCAHGECGDVGNPIFDENQHVMGIYVGRCPPIGRFDPLQFNVAMNINYYRDFLKAAIQNLGDKSTA
ncbi:hypothetical protein QAD02_005933 [Eretmocerus hayati]|uniref:Uncharacterized protein n=1 Tax=Eretmocerus hayati TaxID=131215 RepID=A0ACC2N0N2_9HYME|nr:hypothetical protein QAD02_005933 [Eretmocerus hayati]